MEQNSNNLRAKTITGFLWRFLERVGAQGVQLIVSIILARLLAPELFGTITLISVFTTILSTFVDSEKRHGRSGFFLCFLFQYYNLHHSLSNHVFLRTADCAVL